MPLSPSQIKNPYTATLIQLQDVIDEIDCLLGNYPEFTINQEMGMADYVEISIKLSRSWLSYEERQLLIHKYLEAGWKGVELDVTSQYNSASYTLVLSAPLKDFAQ